MAPWRGVAVEPGGLNAADRAIERGDGREQCGPQFELGILIGAVIDRRVKAQRGPVELAVMPRARR